MKNTKLSVPDISCAHCQESIEGGLGELAGVSSVAVDIDARTVDLVYDPEVVDEGTIDVALEDLGYEVAR